eukprot:7365577-Prymnesium_polylepis.1
MREAWLAVPTAAIAVGALSFVLEADRAALRAAGAEVVALREAVDEAAARTDALQAALQAAAAS